MIQYVAGAIAGLSVVFGCSGTVEVDSEPMGVNREAVKAGKSLRTEEASNAPDGEQAPDRESAETAGPEIGYEVYYGSLHNHSSASGGKGSPSDAYRHARDAAGLDFFGLSDHAEQISSSEWTAIKRAAAQYNQDQVFAAFWGFEWSSDGNCGHVTVVNTPDYTTARTSATDTLEELDEWLSGRDGIALLNHPGKEDNARREFTHFAYQPSDAFVGIELFNVHLGERSGLNYYYNDGYHRGDGNLSYIDEANTRGWRLGAAGGEDNHDGNWGTATESRLAILATGLTRARLLAALRARRFFSTSDRNVALSFKLSGQEMGSTVSAGTSTASIFATDADGERFSRIQLKQSGAVLKTWTPNGTSPRVSSSVTLRGGEYYYVVVRQNDGDEAISSPIWVSAR
ncbi:CehA/McbA family metallohydrolase [Myxococcota bacterium]